MKNCAQFFIDELLPRVECGQKLVDISFFDPFFYLHPAARTLLPKATA